MTDTTAPDAITQADREAADSIDSAYEEATNAPCTCNVDENSCTYCSNWEAVRHSLPAILANHRRLNAHGVEDGTVERIIQADREAARQFILDEWPSWDADHQTVSAALMVLLARHRRLAAHGAGEGLREAFERAAKTAEDAYAPTPAGRTVRRNIAAAIRSLTPPTDAGSTTRQGGERTRVAQLCRERADGYGAIRRSSLTAIALDRAADLLEREEATSSPDASPDSGEAREKAAREVCRIVVEITCAENATPTSMQNQIDQSWHHWTWAADRIFSYLATTSSPDASPDSGEGNTFDQGWKACIAAIGRLGHLPPEALPEARAAFLRAKPKPDVFGGVGE